LLILTGSTVTIKSPRLFAHAVWANMRGDAIAKRKTRFIPLSSSLERAKRYDDARSNDPTGHDFKSTAA